MLVPHTLALPPKGAAAGQAAPAGTYRHVPEDRPLSNTCNIAQQPRQRSAIATRLWPPTSRFKQLQ